MGLYVLEIHMSNLHYILIYFLEIEYETQGYVHARHKLNPQPPVMYFYKCQYVSLFVFGSQPTLC